MADGDRRVEANGVFGLSWEGGWGVLGEVIGREGSSVTRAFEHGGGTELQAGTRASVNSRVYQGDAAALGLAFEQVTYTGELGVSGLVHSR